MVWKSRGLMGVAAVISKHHVCLAPGFSEPMIIFCQQCFISPSLDYVLRVCGRWIGSIAVALDIRYLYSDRYDLRNLRPPLGWCNWQIFVFWMLAAVWLLADDWDDWLMYYYCLSQSKPDGFHWKSLFSLWLWSSVFVATPFVTFRK